MPYKDKADRAANDKARKARDPEKFDNWKASWRERNREHLAAKQRAWNRANALKVKASNLRKYGLTLEQFAELHELQRGLCAICGLLMKLNTNGKQACNVDHCHKTGRVRGLLCTRCNMAIGQFADSPDLMLKAIAYLNRGPAQ